MLQLHVIPTAGRQCPLAPEMASSADLGLAVPHTFMSIPSLVARGRRRRLGQAAGQLLGGGGDPLGDLLDLACAAFAARDWVFVVTPGFAAAFEEFEAAVGFLKFDQGHRVLGIDVGSNRSPTF